MGVSIDGKQQVTSEIKKNKAIEYSRPTTIRELRRFLGLTGWFINFTKDYAKLTLKLTDALKGGDKNKLNWNENLEKNLMTYKQF